MPEDVSKFFSLLYMISLAYKISHCLSANHYPELRCVICTGVILFAPVLHFLHWCYTWTALLSANQNRVIFSCVLLNNYWMRLSMISWIIKTEVCVICRSRRLRQITQTRGFGNSWYHAKTEFNNCFIIQFSHNSYSETEAKRSAILFLKGLSNQADVELDMINANLQQILHLSCQVHKLLWIDWMLSTNQIFHSESDV